MSEIGIIAYNVALVILGINALIVVHEWGHFIVARACGVRCEKFYIWFDFWGLKFFKFKWGGTEYGLGLFPLGGYVKMLGQEDNPGELRRELERAKSAENGELKAESEQTPAAAPQDETSCQLSTLNTQIFAPDSFLAKSVPQRLAIIVAGVAMNFFFAIVCATAAYMVGVEETAPAVGSVVPGSPAWENGIQVGDKITSINGSPARVFTDINMAMVGNGNGVRFGIDRNGEKIEKTLVPRKRVSDLTPMIGVGALPTLDFASEEIVIEPDLKPYYEEIFLKALKRPNLRIAEVDGKPVRNYAEYMDAQLRFFDKPMPVKIVSKNAGSPMQVPGNTEPLEGEVPAIPMRETGLRFRMGQIVNVLPDSGAAKAGIVPGGRIIAVDGQTDFDPLKLPQIILRKVNAEQKSVELKIQKNEEGSQTEEIQTVVCELKPEWSIPELGFFSMKDPVGSTALGLTWSVEPVIEAFNNKGNKETQTALYDNLIGKKIVSVKLLNAGQVLRTTSFCFADEEGVQFVGIGDKVDIPFIFDKMIQASPVKKTGNPPANNGGSLTVRLGIENEKGEPQLVDLPLYDSEDWFNTNRGLLLKAETAVVKIDNIGEAVKLGTAKMVECSLAVFKFLQALTGGTVSPRALSGPVGIVSLAYRFAGNGMGAYLLFLCMIGANLAVINILPIPVLDGGHVIFLLYEGITGKAPNETFQIIVSYMGLALILALMVWVVALDFSCIARF